MTARVTGLAGWAVAFLLAGCSGVIQQTNHAAALQKALATDHAATNALLIRANEAMRPYLLEQAMLPSRTSFAKADLSVLAASDLAVWDQILTGLDSYCAALAALTSGQGADTMATAAETFGADAKALTLAAKGKVGSSATNSASALAAIGDILVREKANRDAQAIARKADPAFQTIIADLGAALAGVQRSYEADYVSSTMPQRLKEFPGDTIANFGALSAAERKAKIAKFSAWVATEQAHDDLIAAFGALNSALTQAAAAHRAFALAGNANLGEIFADLGAEAKNLSAICQKFTN